ncbi:MAG: outer membrane beta-barrel protein [Prevotella sp.]|nr:outer membrane beta-barrel protein [Prevotella sp.]
MNKYLIALILSIAYPLCLSSQNIYGTVIGENHAKLSLATVALLEKRDSTFISGVVSNDDGGFSFKTNPANRLIKVSCVGYNTTIVPAADSLTILLHSSEQNIKEVTVTATRPTFKMTQGMFISSIQGSVFSKLGKATDVLQQLPMMSSDGLSVLGRGTPLVYINNKLMRNSSELQRISSDMIKDIKIDMNPGAKYGSNVRAVIFITTVKPVGEGLGGDLSFQESVSNYWNTDGGLNLNYRKKDIDFFLSTTYNTFSDAHSYRKDEYNFKYNNRDIYANYEGDGYQSTKYGFMSVGFNDQISAKQSIGATYSFSRVFNNNMIQTYHNQMIMDSGTSEFDTSNHNFTQNGSHTMSVYYENKFNDKLSLNVDGTYAHYNNYNKQTVNTTDKDNSSTLIPASKSNSDMAAIKSIFTSPIALGKLEYGFETTYTRYRQKYNVENNDYNGELKNSDNESRQTAANLFVNYSREFGKLYTQMGVKYEYTNYDYYSNGKRIDESCRTYNYILPSLTVSYNIKKVSLALSYNIYTSSPSYSQLDDGLQYISDFRYYRGNSQLKPTYNHDISLIASYRDFQLTCDYTYLKNAIITWFDVMESTPAVLSTDKNFSYSNIYSTISYSPTLFRIWKPSWNIQMYKQWLTYDGLSYNHPSYMIEWKNLITLPKDWKIIVNANGHLRGNADTYMARPMMRMNMVVQKNMNNCRLKFGVSDVFNSKEKGSSQYANAYTSHYVNNYSPTFYLTFTYSFNPAQSKYKGKAAGQSEMKRM